jgi:4a-hydroxytetrahydrobiopterin dehydratase
MKSVEQLLASGCHEMKGPAMSGADVRGQLSVLNEWALDDGALTKTYRFKNYYETLAFVNALAYIVHREDHHPDLHIGYDRCVVRYHTHSVNGISENDFISAAKADALYSGKNA